MDPMKPPLFSKLERMSEDTRTMSEPQPPSAIPNGESQKLEDTTEYAN
jgi:hypothetical protein